MTAVASLAEYGALHGVSKQAAAGWKKRGYLVMQGDQVDVDASEARMKGAGKGRFNSSTKAVKQRAREASTVNQVRQPTRQPSTKPSTTEQIDGDEEGDRYPFRDHLFDPYDRAAVALLPHTAYRIGGAAALAAHELGMASDVAEQLRTQVACSAMEIVGMILDEAEVPPPPGADTWCSVALFDPDKVAEVNWAKAVER